jgi:hypothetical protein
MGPLMNSTQRQLRQVVSAPLSSRPAAELSPAMAP